MHYLYLESKVPGQQDEFDVWSMNVPFTSTNRLVFEGDKVMIDVRCMVGGFVGASGSIEDAWSIYLPS